MRFFSGVFAILAVLMVISPSFAEENPHPLLDGLWEPSMKEEDDNRQQSKVYRHQDGRELEMFQAANGYWQVYVMKGLESSPLEDGYYEVFNDKFFPIKPLDSLVDEASSRVRVKNGYILEWKTYDELLDSRTAN